MKTKYIKHYKARIPKQKIYFGNSADTLASWTGGDYYKHLFKLEILGFKIEFWKYISS